MPKAHYIQDKKLKELVKLIEFVEFVVGDNGQFTLPPDLLKKITYNGAEYQLGIGGIHSCESAQTVIVKDDECLFDIDVASYYPNLIIDGKYYRK